MTASAIFGHLKKLAIPRLAGSGAESEVAGYIGRAFRGAGLKVEEQEFGFADGQIRLIKWWLCLKLALLLVLLVVSIYKYQMMTLMGALLLIFMTIAPLLFGKFVMCLGEVNGQKSRNVLGKLSGDDRRPYLYFIAHYDSKSETVPFGVRVILWLFEGMGCIILGVYCVFSIIRGESINCVFLYLAGFIVVGMLAVLIFSRMGNGSPGALDNGVGVALLLELSKWFGQNQPKNVNLAFLATGAEEFGLCGVKAFLRENKGKLGADNYFVNFDMLGVNGYWGVISGKSKLTRIIKEAGASVGLKLWNLPIIYGVMIDHVPLQVAGYEAATITVISGKSFWVHNWRDTIDLVEEAGIEKALELSKATVGVVDERVGREGNMQE